MAKMGKPYLKCEKRGEVMLVTLYGPAINGHTLRGSSFVPVADMAALGEKIVQMIDGARDGNRVMEKQANGNS